jgi:type IV pilus assembly protein PilA
MLRNRKGFTLIELLIVVVIIGILAAIALPKFGQTRERAYISTMQSDLRQISTAQEMCYQDAFTGKVAYRYCTLEQLETQGLFAKSTGVETVGVALVEPDHQAFSATISHNAAEATCAMNVDGQITCGIGTL